MTDRRTFLSGIALGAFAPGLAAQAPPAGKTARIGLLCFPAVPVGPDEPRDALMQGLRDPGAIF